MLRYTIRALCGKCFALRTEPGMTRMLAGEGRLPGTANRVLFGSRCADIDAVCVWLAQIPGL